MRSRAEKMRERREGDQVRTLIAESASFLDGNLVSELQARGIPVPDWAWISMLANAPAAVLRQHIESSRKRRNEASRGAKWERAAALLGSELLTASERLNCRVEELQRSILLPIELEQHRPSAEVAPMGPEDLVRAVWPEIGRFRASRPS